MKDALNSSMDKFDKYCKIRSEISIYLDRSRWKVVSGMAVDNRDEKQERKVVGPRPSSSIQEMVERAKKREETHKVMRAKVIETGEEASQVYERWIVRAKRSLKRRGNG